ncbi:hypothetical protein C8R45DRAFT_935614 [Mycena sanguinolenta]|nr:hypothetical protein C8R45DRAFT_935614 [Mycena sanguinolenta]
MVAIPFDEVPLLIQNAPTLNFLVLEPTSDVKSESFLSSPMSFATGPSAMWLPCERKIMAQFNYGLSFNTARGSWDADGFSAAFPLIAPPVAAFQYMRCTTIPVPIQEVGTFGVDQIRILASIALDAAQPLPTLTADPKISIRFVPQLANLPTIQLKSKLTESSIFKWCASDSMLLVQKRRSRARERLHKQRYSLWTAPDSTRLAQKRRASVRAAPRNGCTCSPSLAECDTHRENGQHHVGGVVCARLARTGVRVPCVTRAKVILLELVLY